MTAKTVVLKNGPRTVQLEQQCYLRMTKTIVLYSTELYFLKVFGPKSQITRRRNIFDAKKFLLLEILRISMKNWYRLLQLFLILKILNCDILRIHSKFPNLLYFSLKESGTLIQFKGNFSYGFNSMH